MSLPVRLDPVTMDEAVERILAWSGEYDSRLVVTPNVNYAVRAWREPLFNVCLNTADLSLCDGVPLLWAARWLGRPLPERVAGTDLIPRLLEACAQGGLRVAVVGSTFPLIERAMRRVRQRHPNFRYAVVEFHPRDMHTAQLADAVHRSRGRVILLNVGTDCVMTGWIWRALQVAPVIVCIGGGLNMVAGVIPRAPVWMQQAGLEWLYRVWTDPRRLAGRYLRDGVLFAGMLAQAVATRLLRRRI